MSQNQAKAAANVDPQSIVNKAACGPGVELLVRQRPPGKVTLKGGHHEHLLMCTQGSPVEGIAVHSTLNTSSGDREWDTCPDWQITFIPAGVPIDWHWTYASRSAHLTIQPAFLQNVASQLGICSTTTSSLRPVFRHTDVALRNAMHDLQRESTSHLPGNDLMTSSLLNQIGVLLFRGQQQQSLDSRSALPQAVIRQCVELLNDRLSENVLLHELARVSGLSQYHFARLFKQQTGYPPHEYQLRLRIQKAKALLSSSASRSIADIAFELGFSDESHFRRHFKRIAGCTPGQFRR